MTYSAAQHTLLDRLQIVPLRPVLSSRDTEGVVATQAESELAWSLLPDGELKSDLRQCCPQLEFKVHPDCSKIYRDKDTCYLPWPLTAERKLQLWQLLWLWMA